MHSLLPVQDRTSKDEKPVAAVLIKRSQNADVPARIDERQVQALLDPARDTFERLGAMAWLLPCEGAAA